MFPPSFRAAITQFASLPGIGPRMAERIVLALFKKSSQDVSSFAHAIIALQSLTRCKDCFNISDSDHCVFCRDPAREQHILCIVEEPLDIIPIERTGIFRGRYHVLGGTITSTATEEAPDVTLTIDTLRARITIQGVTEIILATNPTADGDATALYLRRVLADTHVTFSRLARGLTTGADIEYADDLTLRSALMHRESLPPSKTV